MEEEKRFEIIEHAHDIENLTGTLTTRLLIRNRTFVKITYKGANNMDNRDWEGDNRPDSSKYKNKDILPGKELLLTFDLNSHMRSASYTPQFLIDGYSIDKIRLNQHDALGYHSRYGYRYSIEIRFINGKNSFFVYGFCEPEYQTSISTLVLTFYEGSF